MNIYQPFAKAGSHNGQFSVETYVSQRFFKEKPVASNMLGDHGMDGRLLFLV